jgi:hypothetical protein
LEEPYLKLQLIFLLSKKSNWQRSETTRERERERAVALAAGFQGLVLWVKKTTYRNHREILVPDKSTQYYLKPSP